MKKMKKFPHLTTKVVIRTAVSLFSKPDMLKVIWMVPSHIEAWKPFVVNTHFPCVKFKIF